MYKITVVPFIKMLNFQSAFIASSRIKNKMSASYPKIYDFCQMKKFGLIAIYGLIILKVYEISYLSIYSQERSLYRLSGS